MFQIFNKEQFFSVEFNSQTIRVSSRQTILSAALEQGIAIPNQCRIGSCLSCKCHLEEGQVIPLTDVDYVLDQAELDKDVILPCQSIARSNLKIRIPTPDKNDELQGVILSQNRLSDAIVELTVKCDQPIAFSAGQYTNLTLSDYPHLTRTYSFSSQPFRNTVSFLVQKVRSGAFSNLVHSTNLLGSRISMSTPTGRFVVAPASSPLLLIAAGSGIAPILSILSSTQGNIRNRDITLMYAGRHLSDLVKQKEISQFQAQSHAKFTYIPVLSDAASYLKFENKLLPAKSGHVTRYIADHLSEQSQVYICGSEKFVTAGLQTLDQLAVNRNQVFVDPFVSTSLPKVKNPVSSPITEASPKPLFAAYN
jgi:ferredoxin-NADP reductase/ferredoxin